MICAFSKQTCKNCTRANECVIDTYVSILESLKKMQDDFIILASLKLQS